MHHPMVLLSRLAPLALVAATLAGCGPGKNEFAPPCPRPSFVQGLSDVTRFRPNTSGLDITDMAVQGRLISLSGECKLVDKGPKTEVTVTMTATFTRGPALQSGQAVIPVFIAVTDGGEVLDKKVFAVPVGFPSNVDRQVLTSPELTLVLPSSREKSPAAFGIVAGFQLTPEELATNKRLSGR